MPNSPSPPAPLSPFSPQPSSPTPVITPPGLFGDIRLSNAHQEGLYNLFIGYAAQSPSPRGEELLEQIREDIEPRELVHPEITVNYAMYKKIRFFLNDHGVDTPSTTYSGGMIVNRLIHAIWSRPEDTADRDKALQQFKAIRGGYFVPSSPSAGVPSPHANPFVKTSGAVSFPPQQTNRSPGTYQVSNAGKGMSVAYSSDKQKIWDKIDEDWLTILSRYQFMCNQNKVGGADKISYLHYLLDGAALKFFINEIEGKVTNWGEVVRRFHDRYASAAKQDYISHRPDEIHISQFETGEGTTESQALRHTIDEMDRLTLMSHPEDRTDRTKMLHLQQAVLG